KLFIAEGPKLVSELLNAIPHQVVKLYALQDWVITNQNLISGTDCHIISDAELDKISQLHTPHHVVAVIRQFDSVAPENSGMCIYLDVIQDPGNFGTIIRIADWFGIKHIVCSEGCADLYNAKVVQSTMGSIARVNVFYDEGFSWLKVQTAAKFAAVLDGASIYQTRFPETGIIIIGNESKGVQPSILELDVKKVSIPKIGQAESLNAAVASGIILSHCFKDY
ncbi:MAG TPA: RNA methyltransferase, partial [Chitinophagaceae bacterium]|nr:RNA methyltransferase [Chitinophagaceae bacterium]